MKFLKYLTFGILLMLLIVLFTGNSYSQLSVSIRKVTDIGQITTDPWQYPLMKARIRAERQGNPVKLDINKILIIENNMVAKPFFVGEFEPDTTTGELWQMIKWTSRREGPNLSYNAQTIMIDSIIVFDNDDIGKIIGWHNRADLSFVAIQNFESKRINELEFRHGDVGSSQEVNLLVRGMLGMNNQQGEEQQIWIDSVKTHSNNFRMTWDGGVIDNKLPPLHIYSSLPYFVSLFYEPKDNAFHTDKLSVYYEHGLKQEIILSGHVYNISEEANNLKIISPNGKEYLTPCQDIRINWMGYVPGMGTDVFYSTDGGAYWNKIGSSDTSFIDWTVPNVNTSKALIRVRQNFQSSIPALLKSDNSPVHRIVFSSEGTHLLSFSESGIITDWDTNPVNLKAVKKYSLDNPDFPSKRFIGTGMAFTKGDSVFAVTYYRTNDVPRKDSIAFFNVFDSIPFLRIGIQQGFNTARVCFDNKKRFLAFIPSLGTVIKIYSAEDGSFIRDLKLGSPVSSFVFNKDRDQAALSLWNGEVQILSLPDFNISSKLDYSDFPLILSMSFAPNGEFLGLGCKSPQSTLFGTTSTYVFVVDIKSGQVIRRMKDISADPIGMEFSPKSTKLLVGVQKSNQINYWDLPVDDNENQFIDHTGNLTDFQFAPLGSMIATSASSQDNLYLRRFTYGESDESDDKFSIIEPTLAKTSVEIPAVFIGENNNYTYNSSLCVSGSSPVFLQVDSLSMKSGLYFNLNKPIPKDTLIFPGECLPLSINYFPRDTGMIIDTIIIHSCESEYFLPVKSVSKPRNIELLVQNITFDPLCIGSTVTKTFPIAINKDPVPLMINSMDILKQGYTPFLCLNDRDKIYQPGDTIFATIRFEPYALQDGLSILIISHSFQSKIQITLTVSGLGIGTEYELSHYDLRFIPEILTRKIKVFNSSLNEIYIQKAVFSLPDYFAMTTVLPVTLKPKSETELEIKWNDFNGTPPDNLVLKLIAGPCAAEKSINLGLYKGSSRLIIPDVFADPRGNATINIEYKNTENFPYKGERFLEGEITVNPRLFLPKFVNSPFGKGELVRNEILNDRRIIGFKIKGDFPIEGRAAEIHGIAGLAETDSSHINFQDGQPYWGSAVTKEFGYGVFHLINICGDRLVLHGNTLTNLSANPNPAEGIIELEFDSQNSGKCDIEVYNSLGIIELTIDKIEINEGKNITPVDLQSLKSGTYNVVIKQGNSIGVIRIIIIK